MSRRRGRGQYDDVQYTEVTEDEEVVWEEDEEAEEEEERKTQRLLRVLKEKKNTILLGAGLFIVGTFLLTLGILILTGVMETRHTDRGWPLVVVGLIAFLPGSWATTITVFAYFQVEGYSLEELPDY